MMTWYATQSESGLLFQARSVGNSIALVDPESVFLQWEDEGYATRTDEGWITEWSALYDMLESGLYGDVTKDFGIPPIGNIVPRLTSSGGLTDSNFSIGIAGWYRSDGAPLEGVKLLGACAHVGSEVYLLPRRVWELCELVRSFLQRSPDARNPTSQRLMWGSIRRTAIQAGARLDEFLVRTVVLAPDRLNIGLRKSAVPGEKVVEITPGFEGCPEGWLATFDRLSRVQDRYDLASPQGVVQVLITPEVKTVLEQIKRMPGRRVVGTRAEALLANPFATLGEAASRVIDADQFEQSKLEAGLVLDHFTAFVETDERGFPAQAGILVQTGSESALQSVRVPFQDEFETERFIQTVRSRLSQQLQVCPWNDFELELLGDTEDQLKLLETALGQRKEPNPPAVAPATVFDLSRYSERIVGFGVEKPYVSIYITKKNDGEGWFPDNAVFLVGIRDSDGSESTPASLAPHQLEELKARAQECRATGGEHMAVPWSHQPMPIDEVEWLIQTIDSANDNLKQGSFDPGASRLDRPTRKSLIIKPNITSVDYLEQRRDLLKGVSAAELPQGLRSGIALKQHQLEGLSWLEHLYIQSPEHCRGAVLADDMGLGKTLQLLCLIAWVRQLERGSLPALVVAPVALLENWREEVQRFFEPGTLIVHEVYGATLANLRLPAHEIDQQLRSEGLVKFLKPGWVGNSDIVLTTYETLRDHEFSFAEQKWSVIVCDEAQKIKNPNALVTRAAKKQNARFRVACTGTPVENTLADLWCLFDFVQPGYLGALNEFGHKYRRPIEAKTDEERLRVEELRSLIEPQIKRRLKKDVAKDLPHKIEDTSCKQLQLSEIQRSLYGQAIRQFNRRQDPDATTPFKNALGLLHYLRLVCTDPQPYGLGGFKAEPLDEYCTKAPKLDWLLQVLREVRRRDEKALIFCEFRDLQRLLKHYVAEAFGYAADIINGDTSADSRNTESRQKRIAAFQRRPGFGAIILSPLAVGFGVNIQAANHVIHYTRTWNPAKEDQATDRAYRIGQTRDVYVYCPVVRAQDFTTFDAKLDELLSYKRALAEDMLNGSGDVGPSEFNISDVAPQSSVPTTEVPLTIDDIDKMAPRYLEAYAAALRARQGFDQVTLTPKSGDGGVDVVAISTSGAGELIQCKSSSRPELGWEAIKDVVTGEAAFCARYPAIRFEKVCLTNQRFNVNARDQARLNQVRLLDRPELIQLLKELPLTLSDVERILFSNWDARE